MAIGVWSLISVTHVSGVRIVGVISFAMGIQNAASTRISGSKVRTTHVSGIATDIGVGMAQMLDTNDTHAAKHIRDRLKLHGATIGSFLVGGTVGVLGYRLSEGAVFCGFSLVILVMCVRYLVRLPQR